MTPAPTLADISKAEAFVDGVPHETFDWLRRESPVHWFPTEKGTLTGGFWALTRHADIVPVNRDAKQFTSTKGAMYPLDADLNDVMSAILLYLDPPEHTRIRRAVARSFSPRVVARFETWIRTVVNDVLDRVETLDSFDYVTEIASVIPAIVVADVIGVPPEDRPKIVDIAHITHHKELSPEHWQRLIRELPGFFQYLLELRDEKLRNPGVDVFTELLNAQSEGEPFSDLELTANIYLVLGGGFETTHTLMGQGTRHFLENPADADLADRLVRDGKAALVVDELLRMTTPAMQMARTAKQDVEINGTKVPKDDLVVLWYTAGNRDPEVFEDPHTFNPLRDNSRLLSFGGGVHFCPGSHVARLEMRILLEEMARRNINLRLDGTPKRGFSSATNQLLELPVARA